MTHNRRHRIDRAFQRKFPETSQPIPDIDSDGQEAPRSFDLPGIFSISQEVLASLEPAEAMQMVKAALEAAMTVVLPNSSEALCPLLESTVEFTTLLWQLFRDGEARMHSSINPEMIETPDQLVVKTIENPEGQTQEVLVPAVEYDENFSNWQQFRPRNFPNPLVQDELTATFFRAVTSILILIKRKSSIPTEFSRLVWNLDDLANRMGNPQNRSGPSKNVRESTDNLCERRRFKSHRTRSKRHRHPVTK